MPWPPGFRAVASTSGNLADSLKRFAKRPELGRDYKERETP